MYCMDNSVRIFWSPFEWYMSAYNNHVSCVDGCSWLSEYTITNIIKQFTMYRLTLQCMGVPKFVRLNMLKVGNDRQWHCQADRIFSFITIKLSVNRCVLWNKSESSMTELVSHNVLILIGYTCPWCMKGRFVLSHDWEPFCFCSPLCKPTQVFLNAWLIAIAAALSRYFLQRVPWCYCTSERHIANYLYKCTYIVWESRSTYNMYSMYVRVSQLISPCFW